MANGNSSASQSKMLQLARHNPADPIAAILSALLIIAGALDLPSKLGISIGQLTVVLGAVGTIAATVRGMIIGRRELARLERGGRFGGSD